MAVLPDKKNKNLFNSFFTSIGVFLEKLFSWKGELEKFIKWTNDHNLKITKIEGCTYLEAGFSSSQISRGHSCAKMEVLNLKNESQGLYLMAYNWADAGLSKSKFVPIEEIKFRQPYKIVNNQLENFTRR